MRCAIYTRKSVAEREDRVFTTLDNQRAFCSAYIASQAGQGWIEMPARYDDGGFSGGTLHRPALDRLREDARAGLIDMVVVYKIDRLSRSLKDFANLVDEFEKQNVNFTAVTQSFDTSNAMGKLTLNILLSFAQFERELTGERLTDWFAGARARGQWTRARPYGYAKINGNDLVPDPVEAAVVREIFRLYCRYQSCQSVANRLHELGLTNTAGRPWSASMVLHTIKHRVYLGEMTYRGSSMPGNMSQSSPTGCG